jgi:hypothetical protein
MRVESPALKSHRCLAKNGPKKKKNGARNIKTSNHVGMNAKFHDRYSRGEIGSFVRTHRSGNATSEVMTRQSPSIFRPGAGCIRRTSEVKTIVQERA